MGDLAGKRRTGVAALPRECGFFVSGFTVFVGALDIGVVLGCRKSARHRADACWMLSSWVDSGCFCGVVERGHVMIIGMRCFCVDVGIFLSVSVLRNFCKFVDCVILWNASLHRCDGLCVGRFCALKAGRTKHSKKR